MLSEESSVKRLDIRNSSSCESVVDQHVCVFVPDGEHSCIIGICFNHHYRRWVSCVIPPGTTTIEEERRSEVRGFPPGMMESVES